MIDRHIVDSIQSSGIDIILSLPCNMLSGIFIEIAQRNIVHIPVCREEEGVGIAAGAALAGKKPMLLMQNSGLGNSINTLASLTLLYKLPLFIMMSHRGGPGEQILAQIPMGKASPELLKLLRIDFIKLSHSAELVNLGPFIKKTFEESLIHAAFLSRELWHEEK
ncbi:MAG: sulfopyruvate decarboxylase subunit alpha [Pseudomonadota bacterium]|jgi:sulfopyruvate decarboxylase subunit alpha